jgi:hypothetical protein
MKKFIYKIMLLSILSIIFLPSEEVFASNYDFNLSTTNITINGTINQPSNVCSNISVQNNTSNGWGEILSIGNSFGSSYRMWDTQVNNSGAYFMYDWDHNYYSGQICYDYTGLSAGTYYDQLTYEMSGVQKTVYATINLAPPIVPDFTIGISPVYSLTTSGQASSAQTYSIALSSVNSLAGYVNLSVASGCPAGASCTFSNSTPYLYANGSASSLMFVTPSGSFANGSYTVNVNGVNGGTTHSAQAFLTVSVPSGTISSSPTSCTIVANASSCNTAITWSTSNPQGTSSVTSSYPVANTTVATGNSGSTSVSIPYSSRVLYLYNNGALLNQVTVTSSCAGGTSWNGSICIPYPPTGTLSASPTSCTIAANASSCNTTLTWSTNNPQNTSTVTSSYPVANTTVASGNSGNNNASVPYASRDFYLYNGGVLLAQSTVTSSCISGSAWNGSMCAVIPITVSLSASPSSMTLPTNSTTLSWSTGGNPDSCNASGSWIGSKMTTAWSENITGLTAGNYTYTITCSKSGTSDAVSSAAVTVGAAQSTANISVSPTSIYTGDTVTLTWSSTNAAS